MKAVGYDGPVTDSDIHHVWANDSDLLDYMPQRWKEYALLARRRRPGASQTDAARRPTRLPIYPAPSTVAASGAHGGRRADTFPESGGKSGSDYDMLRRQLLDPYSYYRAVLTFDTAAGGIVQNPHWGAAICRAMNEWNREHWLALDARLFGTVTAAWTMPQEASEEIRRAAKKSGNVVAIDIHGNPFGRPIGDPIYHPLFETANELGLAVFVHPGMDRPTPATTTAGGTIIDGVSQVAGISQQGMHHVTSLIVHGVFEKYPNLKFVINEVGVAWLPGLIWKLEQNYELLRIESPWVRRWPSDYIRRSVRLSTQPLEESPDPQGLVDLLSGVEGIEDILCFSTDYPHFSFDEPRAIGRRLPMAWQRKVMCDNLCDALGWTSPSALGSKPVAVGAS